MSAIDLRTSVIMSPRSRTRASGRSPSLARSLAEVGHFVDLRLQPGEIGATGAAQCPAQTNESVSNGLAGETLSRFLPARSQFLFHQFRWAPTRAALGGVAPAGCQIALSTPRNWSTTRSPVVVFDQGGAILNPIAAVVVGLVADAPNDRAVDVTTENALDIESLGIANDRILVGADEADRVLDPALTALLNDQ